MGKSVHGLVVVAMLVGSIGAVLAVAQPSEAVGPSIRGYSHPGGTAPSSRRNQAPTPSNLKRQGNNSGSSSQSGPTTFGYWNGSSFVRTPGPWSAPDQGSKPANQRLR
jgi:hypothetical protein